MDYPIVEWIRQNSTINTERGNQLPSITTDIYGNTYVTYKTDGGTASGQTNTNNSPDIVIFKINSSGNIDWVRQNNIMNTSLLDDTPTITTDYSGYVYVTYQTTGVASGQTPVFPGQNIVVFKMDPSGSVMWIRQNRTMNSTVNKFNPNITVDISGNVCVAYQTTGTASGETKLGTISQTDIVVFKMDSTGNVLWVRQNQTMNTTANDFDPNITTDSSGNIYVSYTTVGVSSGQGPLLGIQDIVIFKMNSVGNVEWVRQNAFINTPDSDSTSAIIADNNGNLYLTYTSSGISSGNATTGSSDIIVVKMSTSGIVEWVRQNPMMNTDQADFRPDITCDSTGNVYVSYQTFGGVASGQSLTGLWDIIVFKMNPSGNVEWIRQTQSMNTMLTDQRPKVSVDSGNNVYVAYDTFQGTASGQGPNQSNNFDIVVFKLRQIPFITNSFPVITGSSYLTVGHTLLFTQAAVEALQADSDLPMEPLASWLPDDGLPAESLLRDLKKTVVVTRNKLQAYKFRLVQLIDGAATEGVGGTVGDIEPYRCGYICTWAASGIPYTP